MAISQLGKQQSTLARNRTPRAHCTKCSINVPSTKAPREGRIHWPGLFKRDACSTVLSLIGAQLVEKFTSGDFRIRQRGVKDEGGAP